MNVRLMYPTETGYESQAHEMPAMPRLGEKFPLGEIRYVVAEIVHVGTTPWVYLCEEVPGGMLEEAGLSEKQAFMRGFEAGCAEASSNPDAGDENWESVAEEAFRRAYPLPGLPAIPDDVVTALKGVLEKLPMVQWDRFTVWGDFPFSFTVYGWIDRPRTYKDFLTLDIEVWPAEEGGQEGAVADINGHATSSEEWSEKILRALEGDDAVDGGAVRHLPCVRVEWFVHDLPNVIRL